MAFSGEDLAATLALAAIILIAYITRKAYTRPADLAGFWASAAGELYEIVPGRGREFTARAAGLTLAGRVRGLRTLCVEARGGGEARGRVGLSGESIAWRGGALGGTWWRQGLAR